MPRSLWPINARIRRKSLPTRLHLARTCTSQHHKYLHLHVVELLMKPLIAVEALVLLAYHQSFVDFH